ncbi:MAG: sulfotransferase [Actinomycetota bacterium]
MAICIAGLPGSGTRMVARLLGDFGLDLGPEEELSPIGDDSDDSWRNRRFVRLNDEILGVLDAVWDSPPAGDWIHIPSLEPVRRSAAILSESLALREPWGWADPRNSLTFPFWRDLFPDLRVVVCVRHPRDAAEALESRGLTSATVALRLWTAYYRVLLDLAEHERVVTHYESYREDPRAEVERLTCALGLEVSRAEIARGVARLDFGGAPPDHDDAGLTPDVEELYDRLLMEAQSTPQTLRPRPNGQGTLPGAEERRETADDLRQAVQSQRRELEHLRMELARRRGYMQALQVQLDVGAAMNYDLPQVIQNLEEQLLERDEELATEREERRRAEATMRAEIEWRRETEESLARGIEGLEQRSAALESTRLVRWGRRYWSLKQSIREGLRRGRP